MKLWRQDLQSVNEKAAESLADPMEYQNLFTDLKLALKAEQYLDQYKNTAGLPASSDYPKVKDDLLRDMIEEVRNLDVPSKDEK